MTKQSNTTISTWLDGAASADVYHQKKLSVLSCSIVAVRGPHQGMVRSLSDELFHIGRDPWCDLALPGDNRLSRHHCTLKRTTDGVVVRDLRSSNGTSLHGVRVREAIWLPGQELQVGQSVFALQVQEEKAELQVNCFDQSGRLVGESDEMRELFSLLARLAPLGLPVLLQGEREQARQASPAPFTNKAHS